MKYEEMRKEFRDFLQQFVNKYYCRIRIDDVDLVAVSAYVDNNEVYSLDDEDSVQLYHDPLDNFEPEEGASEEECLIKTDLVKLSMAVCCGHGIGLSAQEIIAYCTGVATTSGHEPCDSNDVGRCVSLLSYFPEWKKKIKDIDSRFPCWGSIGRHWDEIETAYTQMQFEDVNALLDKYRGIDPNVIRV